MDSPINMDSPVNQLYPAILGILFGSPGGAIPMSCPEVAHMRRSVTQHLGRVLSHGGDPPVTWRAVENGPFMISHMLHVWNIYLHLGHF